MTATAIATVSAEAPSYAADGSRGYTLTITDGPRHITGWIRIGDDGHTVYCTIDGAPWRPVGSVDNVLTPAWVATHADAILHHR